MLCHLFCLANLLLVSVTSSNALVQHKLVTPKYQQLNNILHDLTLQLPVIKESINVFGSTADVTLYELSCTNITIQDITVETQPTHVHTLFNITGAAISCHSKYNLSLGDSVHGSGSVVLASQGTSLSAVLAIDKTKDTPTNARLPECDAQVVVSNLEFRGGPNSGADLLNAAKGLILSKVTTLVDGPNGALCQTLKNTTENKLTSLLLNVSQVLHQYIQPPPGKHNAMPWKEAETKLLSTLGPGDIHGLADLKESPLLDFLHWFIKLELGTPTPCFLTFGSTALGSLGINNIITLATKQTPGTLNITLPTPFALINANLIHANANSNNGTNGFGLKGIDLSINLTSIGIGSVNTFTTFDVLRPVSNYTLQTDVALDDLDLDLAFDVVYKTESAPNQEHHAHVVVRLLNLKQIVLNISTLVAVNEAYLNTLPVSAAFAHLLGCSSHSLMDVNLTQVEMTVVSTGPPPTVHGALSREFDAVLENMLDLVTFSYETILLQALPNVFIQEIFPMINQRIDSYLALDRSSTTCNHTIPTTRHQLMHPVDVNLYESTVVSLLNTLVEDLVAPNINNVLKNITEKCWGKAGTIDIGTEGQDLLATSLNIPQIGTLAIGMQQLEINNIDTFEKIELFDTTSMAPNRITSNVQLGGDSRPLGVSIGIKWDVTPPPPVVNGLSSHRSGVRSNSDTSDDDLDPVVRDQFRLGFELTNLTSTSDLLLKINRFNTMAIPIGRLSSVPCVIGLLDDLKVMGLDDGSLLGTLLQSNLTNWTVDCVSHNNLCSSPGLLKWSTLSKNPKYVQQLSAFINLGWSKLIAHAESDVFRKQWSAMLLNSSQGCGYKNVQNVKDVEDVDALQHTKRRLNDPVPFNQWHPAGWAPPVCPWDKGIAVTYGILTGLVLLIGSTWFFVKCSRLEQAHGRCKYNGCCWNCTRCCRSISASICCRLCFKPNHDDHGNRRQHGVFDTTIDPSPLLNYAIDHHQIDTYNASNSHSSSSFPSSSFLNDNNDILHKESMQPPPLVFHPSIPPFVRYGMLCMIVVDISLFFSSHASMGASVDLLLNVFGDHFRYNTIFPFGLGYSLVNLWKACAVTLVAFLATFSGGWVYLKLLLMSLLWCTPTTMLSTTRRGKYFHYLDMFGKWSLLDLLVLTQSMVGFYVRIKHPQLEILPPDFYALDLIVTPAYGLYSFSVAITLSLVLSHIQVVYHNKALAYDTQESTQPPTFSATLPLDTIQDAYDLIPNHNSTMHAEETQQLVAGQQKRLSLFQLSTKSNTKKILLMLLPLISLVFLCWGAVVPSWTFQVRGMVGIVAEFGEKGSTTHTYSFYSAIVQLVEQSKITTPALSAFGVLFIMFMYSAFSFIVPCLHLLAMFCLCVVPMKLSTMKALHVFTHICSSFAAMEVWILATVVTVLQIKFVSYSVLDAQCSALLPTFNTLANFGFIDQEDANCFQIDGRFNWQGMLLLMVSVAVGYCSQLYIMRESEAVIQCREMGKGSQEQNMDEKGTGENLFMPPSLLQQEHRSFDGSINY